MAFKWFKQQNKSEKVTENVKNDSDLFFSTLPDPFTGGGTVQKPFFHMPKP